MDDQIKIEFTMYHEDIPYGDALWLPADHTFTEAEIEAMKLERFNAWVAVITGANQPQE